jgi:hypothetical protein
LAEPKSERKVCVPEHIGLDSLNLILIAYLKAGADKKAVSYREASLRSGVHYTIVSANNKFYVSAGFLVEEGKGQLKLTEIGAKYAQMLDWGRLEEAKAQLRQLLLKCPIVNVTLDYVGLKKEVTREDLNTKIGSDVHLSRAARYVTGINALIDMLVSAGLLEEKEGKLRKVAEGAKIAEREKPAVAAKGFEDSFFRSNIDFDTIFKPTRTVETPKPKSMMPVSLTINVTDATDIKKLKQILKAIREELSVDK